MKINFRKMIEEDRSEVLAMMRGFYRSPALYTDGSEDIFVNDFRNCVNESPYLEGYTFECDGIVCGYSMIAKSFSTEFGKPCIWVEDLYIKENYRNAGIGTQFFSFLYDQYSDVIFRLEVEKENLPVIHLYQKAGYQALPYLEMKK